MKSRRTVIAVSMMLCIWKAVAMPVDSAALTPACTQINNTATVSFSVAGVAQPPASGSASFIVGNKVDVVVTTLDAGFVIVPPGSLATAMTFSITNNGNATQKYSLTAVAEPNGTPLFGGADDFDATNVKIYVGGVQTNTIASLTSAASQSVTIVADIPYSQHDGDVAVYALKAVTGNIDSSPLTEGVGKSIVGGVAACTGDVVFGDGAGTDDSAHDAAYSSRSAVKVIAADLTIIKSSVVLYDPVHCASLSPTVCVGNAKPIPGALVEYTVRVANTATGTATNITISDILDANTTFYPDGYAAGKGLQVTAPNLYGGNPTALTNAAGDDEGAYNAGTRTVTVNSVRVMQNQEALVKFKAIIN